MKKTSFDKQNLLTHYVTPLNKLGVPQKDVIAFTLDYNEAGKAPVTVIKNYLSNLLPALDSLGVKYLLITDAAYFKTLTGQGRAEPHFGYALPCTIKGFEHMKVVLSVNYQQLIYNPTLSDKLQMSLHTLASNIQGTHQALGHGIIHSAEYPQGYQAIAEALKKLHSHPSLSVDIEAFSLDFDKAGIGTITFCWDEHNGIAFACDYNTFISHEDMCSGLHGGYQPNLAIRAQLVEFFRSYEGNLTFHHAGYDVKVIIYTLFMKDLLDTEGLLDGLEVMTKNIDDTKIIAYLATNTTAGNHLGLKHLAHEFAGNWAVEVKDIRKVPLEELLEYNLVDGLSTNFVKKKYYPIMVQDKQEDLYLGLMKDSLKTILQIELTGMPMNAKKVQKVKAELEVMEADCLSVIQNSAVIATLNLLLQESKWEKDFQDRKTKAKNPDKILPKNKLAFAGVEFNPNSGPQLQTLLYEQMGLPILDLTDTKLPATGADTIEKLIHHTTEPTYIAILQALIDYSKIYKILHAFIPAFETAIAKGTNDIVWLHGSFNIGGTVSGRLSSSDPNLQQIPAGNSEDKLKAKLGKMIKDCFEAPKGWLFCGADFNSLEDMISALTTKDPNKLKVYTDGFDGHSLRASFYFADKLPHIDSTDPKSVNTIKKTHPDLRQESKAPTFLLTYGGTFHGMMKNLGWSKEKSQAIEENYHKLYVVSDQYIQTRLEQAAKDGFVEVAFGLRVRTPLLAQVIYGSQSVPYEAQAEGRTAGNAMGQSYGLLNNRAAAEFMKRVWKSKYRLDIKPVALIHDAIYILIRDDIEVVEWANRELIDCMRWQELPEIQHPTVKLGAALDIFWPTWANATTIPNDASQEEILKITKEVFNGFKN